MSIRFDDNAAVIINTDETQRDPVFGPVAQELRDKNSPKLFPWLGGAVMAIKERGAAPALQMHVKTGDTVQVITGKDKGKVGEIVNVPQVG